MPCHNPNGAAPDYVDLTFYGTDTQPGARAWAAAIQDEIMMDRMPPWDADPRFGEFQNSRRLTDDEKDMIVAWIQGGGPQGPLRNLEMPEELQEKWGYKPIGEETKAKILGLNLAGLAKIDTKKRVKAK